MVRLRLVISVAIVAGVLVPLRAAAQSLPVSPASIEAVPNDKAGARLEPRNLNLNTLVRETVRLAGSEHPDRSRDLKTSGSQTLFSRPCYSPVKRAIVGAVVGAVAGGAFAIYVGHRGLGVETDEVLLFGAAGAGIGAVIGFGSC